MTDSNTELIERCRRGDSDAVELLVRRFRARALDLAGALTGDDHLAEDAVQTAFVVALEHLDELREPRAFAGWFRRIVRTQCSRIRRRRREEPVPDVVLPDAVQESPQEQTARAEMYRQVRFLLRRLPADQRRTAELFYFEDRGCAEIAASMGVPKGTVKRRLYDLRGRLRSMLLGYLRPGAVPEESRPRQKLPL